MQILRTLLFVFFCGTLLAAPWIDVSFMGGYDPDTPEGAVTRHILAYARKNPELRPVKWGGLSLPGAGGRSPLLLAMAGGNAPDIYYCWFHIIQNDIENGFLMPLNKWIGEDKNGNGQIDDDEAIWDGWKKIPNLWRRVATKNGKIYGLPSAGIDYYGIIYRKDLVRAAGLDPEKIPQTWDEFWLWCQKLTRPNEIVPGSRVQRGKRAFGISAAPWNWLPWLQSTGASPIVQVSADGSTYPMEFAADFPVQWRANFDSQGAKDAAKWLQKLMWQPWIMRGNEPHTLSDEELKSGKYPESEIIYGVARQIPLNDTERFILGEVAAMFAGTEAMERLTANTNLDPDLIGIMPFPSQNASLPRLFQAHRHFWGISEGVKKRPENEQNLIFGCIEQLASASLKDAAIREKVLEGNARWCQPEDLKRLNLDAYLDEIPLAIREIYGDLKSGIIESKTEPFVGFWQGVSDLIQRRLIGIILSSAGRDFDVEAALESINFDANNGLMFKLPDEKLQKYRPTARIIATLFLAFIAWLIFRIVKTVRGGEKDKSVIASETAKSRSKNQIWIAVAMLIPALILITVWSYYPLIQGVIIAFKNYHIVGESSWAGFDNFIQVAIDSGFWSAVCRTLKYVALTMLLGFFTPVILAILLMEIPRGRILYRTLYFLPHLTSTLVITLLWQMMYDPTENGMLNQLLHWFGVERPLSWLQDPALAMICCILPGVWAGAGMASLIYIAALQALPMDYYEAAAIDGAGFFSRVRHVMLPQLLPLMVINFVGAFIASFQNIGSIFLLTFGGPGDATNVLSLAIWKEAYNNLRFGMATSMAWFLGTALICFTYLQFKILRKVEFRQVESN